MLKKELHLFEAYGIELEYMIVDAISLDVKPVCDSLMKAVAGEVISEYDNGAFAWSNEIVNHVVEIKTNGPTVDIQHVAALFHENVREINCELENLGARLMPGAMHPWMNPYTETQLWPHEHSEIYQLYNKIFDCRGHGWSNLQSTHINLPFIGDDEFGRLHAATRLILPLIPAIAAASPFMEGNLTGIKDSRLEAYRHNQTKFPSITGLIIPERVYTKADYQTEIFDKIMKDIRPFDSEHILDRHFLNSRGAIARFDRNALEIRLMDIQECPRADVAIIVALVSVLKLLCLEKWSSLKEQKEFSEVDLLPILLDGINKAETAEITNEAYLKLFGYPDSKATGKELWQYLFTTFKSALFEEHVHDLNYIIEKGSLATRLESRLGKPDKRSLYNLFDEMTDCLANNTLM